MTHEVLVSFLTATPAAVERTLIFRVIRYNEGHKIHTAIQAHAVLADGALPLRYQLLRISLPRSWVNNKSSPWYVDRDQRVATVCHSLGGPPLQIIQEYLPPLLRANPAFTYLGRGVVMS